MLKEILRNFKTSQNIDATPKNYNSIKIPTPKNSKSKDL